MMPQLWYGCLLHFQNHNLLRQHSGTAVAAHYFDCNMSYWQYHHLLIYIDRLQNIKVEYSPRHIINNICSISGISFALFVPLLKLYHCKCFQEYMLASVYSIDSTIKLDLRGISEIFYCSYTQFILINRLRKHTQ